MFENVISFFKRVGRKDKIEEKSKDTAKERLHLVLMQDRANVSADFLDMMRQEIIEVIKKYIDVDENDIDVRLTNKMNEDGTTGAPALYANIPIAGIKENVQVKETKIEEVTEKQEKTKEENNEEGEENSPVEEIAEVNNEEIEPKDMSEETEEVEGDDIDSTEEASDSSEK